MSDDIDLTEAASLARRAMRHASDLQDLYDAMERRMERADKDRERLGRMLVTQIERYDDGERAMSQLSHAVSGLKESVDALMQSPIMTAAQIAPGLMPSNETIKAAWHSTPAMTKAKIGGGLIAVLSSAEFLKQALEIAGKLILKLIH